MRFRRPGKFPRKFMKDAVYKNLGSPSAAVIVGPGAGLDNAVLDLGDRHVMMVTEDPVSAIPALGMRLSAWLSMHLVASDYATSGCRPRYATLSYNFPESMTGKDCASYVRGIGKACADIGVSIVGGHTGAYPGSSLTVVGSCTMFGFEASGSYVTPRMARAGDDLLMTKGAGIEAAAFLAWAFPKWTEDQVGASLASKARSGIRRCSTFEDSMVAAEVGLGEDGVTSMHDATEGGIMGAAWELAEASGHGIEADLESIFVPEESSAVCDAFGIDPLRTVSEGALLLTCARETTATVVAAMAKKGIRCASIGRVFQGKAGLFDVHGRRIPLGKDGYWEAYESGVRRRLP